MSDKRQKNQRVLAFMAEETGEAQRAAIEGTESLAAKRGTESPAIGEQLMEEVCERENCKLEKFFDQVSHDKLMAKIAERVSDKRLLKLIRAFLAAGVMEGGLVSSIGSWSGEVSGSHGTRTTVTSTFAAGGQESE